MKGTVVLVEHNVGKRDDRASAMLAGLGYRLAWICPQEGDALPPSGEDHVAALVYGGVEDLSRDGSRPYLQREMDWIRGWVAEDKPLLGICLGGQLLARALGARVAPHPQGRHEIGYVEVTPAASADGFLEAPLKVYQWHKEGFDLPEGAQLLATGNHFPNQAFRYGRHAYGLQFHPEVSPAVAARWIEESGHKLVAPGAHSRERQMADAASYDGAVETWLRAFLVRWLEGG